jgi:hypothetical protein
MIFTFKTSAQSEKDSVSFFKEHFEVRGYLKYLHTSSFLNLDNMIIDNLFHNRINTKAFINDNWTAKIDLRNRIFYGDQVNLLPSNYKQLEVDPGIVDLSFLWIDQPAIYGHTIIDRAYLDYQKGKINMRLGRQRVNWGINLAWNPNDLFNAYNFADFDYEERPGMDGIRLQYFTSGMNSIDFAASVAEDIEDITVAGKYVFNKKGYDIQLLGGKYLTDVAIGGGWAGNIKQAGFKGEATYFHDYANLTDTSGAISGTVSFDYLFSGKYYVNVSGLYNSVGVGASGLNQNLFGNVNAKTLMPNKWSSMAQFSVPLNPLFSASIAGIYAIDLKTVFFMPSISYSISQNWECYVVGQNYFGDQSGNFKSLGNSIFMRFKWSF